jgi:hypothetical protein
MVEQAVLMLIKPIIFVVDFKQLFIITALARMALFVLFGQDAHVHFHQLAWGCHELIH